jgi:P4 family phage/plasmid primase-like protien
VEEKSQRDRVRKQLHQIFRKPGQQQLPKKGDEAMKPHEFGTKLSETDIAMLGRSGISREHAEKLPWRRVDSVDGREIVGRNGSGDDYTGIAISYRIPGEERIREYRLRLDNPPLVMKSDGSVKPKYRYLSPLSRHNKVYFASDAQPEWLSDIEIPVLVVEGEKKGESGAELAWYGLGDGAEKPRWLSIGLPGAWGFRGTVGKHDGPNGERQDVKGVIGDFDRISWKGRRVIICFDHNVYTDEHVRIARLTLAKELRGRGAHVLFADLPADDPSINGIDDYVGKYGSDAALKVLQNAYDPKSKPVGELTEEKLAEQFEIRYLGDMYFDHDRGHWFIFNEARGYWVENRTHRAFHFARELCRNLNVEEKKEFARAHTYGNIEQIARKAVAFSVTNDFWNRDIWLLGTPGGTVDLRTGKLCPPSKQDHITKSTAVAPDFKAEMPVFQKFLKEITNNDADLQQYLQHLAGYSLTGSTREQKLFFWCGPGGNGKSVLLNTEAGIAGDYHVTAAMEAFVEQRGEHHPTELAMLAGARMVTASETQKGRRWNEAIIGRVTGGDPISARWMRRDFFTYTPQFTLIIVGNHEPELGSVNEANRRRFQITPFTFQPKAPDEKLAEKLRPEWPAILAWMIHGARDWYERGLGELPAVVREETQSYFEQQDDVRAWVEECCVFNPDSSDTSKNLFQSYELWCKQNGMHPDTQKSLISTLKRMPYNCKKDRSSRRRGLKGIAVKAIYQPDPRTGEKDE